MRYVIRADASLRMGSGHVMRTSAIAEELISRGEEVLFVGDVDGLYWVTQRLEGLGFSRILTPSDDFKPDQRNDILILDSYTIPINDDFILEDRWKFIVSIADESTPDYSCNLMVRPGLKEDWKGGATRVLSGPRFIPFRNSILKSENFFQVGDVPNILIVGGGADPYDFVGTVGRALQDSSTHFHAYLFSNNIFAHDFDSRFEIIPIGERLDSYALTANLAITTASTTCLEFLAREIAVGVGCAVDNQEKYYDLLTRRKFASPVGKRNLRNWDINKNILTDLVISENLREELRSASRNLIDLNGAKRIVDEIQSIGRYFAK